MSERRFPQSAVFYRDLHRAYAEVVGGEGVYLYDGEGRRYLDASGGAVVVNVGHGRAELGRAIGEQAEKVAYAHGSYFTTRALEEMSAALAAKLPSGLDKIYLVHGGAEATETAIKLARQYHLAEGRTGKYRVIGCWPSYHGNTLGALAASGKTSARAPYQPLLAAFPHVPAAYCYRCPWGASYPDCALRCADSLEDVIRREGADTISAFLVEPVIGATAGAAVPPREYLPRVREICDRYDVLLIADEVMTGLGRTGRYFAVEHSGVVPDMMLLGKGLSGGYLPVGAVAVSTPIVESVRQRFGNFTHGYTFSHHPVVAAACREALSIVEREELVRRAEERGLRLLAALERLYRFDFVGDVRGCGLMTAVELVADRETKRPFPRQRRLAEEVTERAFAHRLILWPGTGSANGVDGDLVMVAPPFVVTEEQIDQIVSILEEVLKEIKP